MYNGTMMPVAPCGSSSMRVGAGYTPVFVNGLDVVTPHKWVTRDGHPLIQPGRKIGTLSAMPFDTTVRNFGKSIGNIDYRV